MTIIWLSVHRKKGKENKLISWKSKQKITSVITVFHQWRERWIKNPKCLADIMPLLLLLVMYSPSQKNNIRKHTQLSSFIVLWVFSFIRSHIAPFCCCWFDVCDINGWASTTDGINFIDKVNCNRIQAASTEHQHQYCHRNKPIPAITPRMASECMNKKAGEQQNNLQHG